MKQMLLLLLLSSSIEAATRIQIVHQVGRLAPRTDAPNALIIKAVGDDEAPVAGVKVLVRTLAGSDALVYGASKADGLTPSVTVETAADGTASIGVLAGETGDIKLYVVPLDENDQPVIAAEEVVELTERRSVEGSFFSRRVYTEVFTGVTVTNDYDETGKSTGFSEAAPLARALFDTVWWPDRRQKKEAVSKWRQSLFHSGMEMQVADFPFGQEGTSDPEEESPKGFDEAFSGALYALYQPDRWANYTDTSTRMDAPTDAFRLGILAKAGMTTRPTVSAGGDTAFWRYQVGLKFTHHQTKAGDAYSEQDNIVPARFVEVSYGYFEEFAGQQNVGRLVIDAGFRLPGLGSDPIPFYAGIHLNAGEGPDDLRIFAGFLFKINEIAEIFQRAQ